MSAIIRRVTAILSNDDPAGDRLDRLYDLLDGPYMTGDQELSVATFLDQIVRGYLECAAWTGAGFDGLRCPECFRAFGPNELTPSPVSGLYRCPTIGCIAFDEPERGYDPDTGEGGQLEDARKLEWSPDARRHAIDVCREFYLDNSADCEAALVYASRGTTEPWEQVGHDIWLTRNRHGAGFWDRGYGPIGVGLTEAANALGEDNVWIDQAGELHFETEGR
jgi:hypothetical protein